MSTAGAVNSGGDGNMEPTKLPGSALLYVGGFGAEPLRVYEVNKQTGALTERPATFAAGPSPAYFALHPQRTHLYVANEDDGNEGGITAFSIAADGSLELINHQAGSDGGFTHLSVTPDGKFVLGASYNGGSVSVFPIDQSGGLGAEANLVDFGEGSQAHCVAYDDQGKYVLVPTKGADAVQQLLLDAAGQLTANTPPSVASANGAGPRHIALHPSGGLAFVINELSSSVTSYQLADGKLTAGATLSSLPQDYDGNNTGAHIEVSPNGRFVYASNRGHDSIVTYSVNELTGELLLLQHAPTGNTPRDFDVDPNGELLIAANQDDGTLSVYRMETTGQLTPLGGPVATRSQPCALQFHYIP
jgi:6-phosphogluconolactonase